MLRSAIIILFATAVLAVVGSNQWKLNSGPRMCSPLICTMKRTQTQTEEIGSDKIMRETPGRPWMTQDEWEQLNAKGKSFAESRAKQWLMLSRYERSVANVRNAEVKLYAVKIQ